LFNISQGNSYHLINTRRIGASPDYNCTDFSAANGGSDVLQESCENGQEASNGIDTAVKYSQLGEHTDFGFFAAFEGDETFSAGREFYAVRALRRLNQHKIGYLATHVERGALDRRATVHAFDYENQITEFLTLNSLLVHSDTTDESGNGMRFEMNYDPNQYWVHRVAFFRFDDDLDINDMGYQSRNNVRGLKTHTNYTQTNFPENSKFLEREYRFGFSKRTDTHGLQLSQSSELEIDWRFKDTSGFGLEVEHSSSGNDDLMTRGNALAPFIKFGQGWEWSVGYNGRQNERWSYWAMFEKERVPFSSFTTSKTVTMLGGNFYPSDELKISMMMGNVKVKNWPNWLGDNKVGTYPLDYFSIRTTVTWFPKENHELRIKFQTIVMETETGAEWLADSAGNLNSANSPATGFDLGQLAFQVRYKYEIGPLSHFYAVYTRGGRHYEDDNVSVSKIISGTWDNPQEDRFTLKLRIKF